MVAGAVGVLAAGSENGKAGGLLVMIFGGALHHWYFDITKTRVKNGELNLTMVWNYMGIVVMLAGVACVFRHWNLCGALLIAGGGVLFLITTVRGFLFVPEDPQ